MGKLIAQILKFGIVGAIAFVVDYFMLIILTEIFDFNYLVSATISFFVAMVFNYLASMRYVFSHKEEISRHREFVIFGALSVIGLLFNDACMWVSVELLGIHYLLAKIIATFVVMVWNFTSRKKILDAGENSAGALTS